ncbi:sugar O-acetyltransferase [Aestuariibaculum sediminum]|uniref:Acetyltransferase n=1 Tax=Aestuariibaculum sediminum TaxID=2770637 RepID=A0A8J6Q817_9FLAO|nr:sugar O-acetyltransferase [Aestuariibaculum sediminum]MBD0832983.1 sugar O-acetyltransferase [Aestuariibaculum sediminum]
MSTEKEKMLTGKLYKPSDPELTEARYRARLLFQEFNNLNEDHFEERSIILTKLFTTPGNNLYIEPPFFCDYGKNIILGENVYMNFNCCILDAARVTIGNNCMIAPNVQIYTATHPVEYKARNSGKELAKPISIGDNVWIGGNSTICPGVTLGNNVVVGAGAVVTKSFPSDVVIAGNPAKIIKTINNH